MQAAIEYVEKPNLKPFRRKAAKSEAAYRALKWTRIDHPTKNGMYRCTTVPVEYHSQSKKSRKRERPKDDHFRAVDPRRRDAQNVLHSTFGAVKHKVTHGRVDFDRPAPLEQLRVKVVNEANARAVLALIHR